MAKPRFFKLVGKRYVVLDTNSNKIPLLRDEHSISTELLNEILAEFEKEQCNYGIYCTCPCQNR